MLLPLSYLIHYMGPYLKDFPSPDEGADFLMNPPRFYDGENLIESGAVLSLIHIWFPEE